MFSKIGFYVLYYPVQVADENSLQMEQFMIDVCEEESGMMGFEVLAFTARSFNDVSFATIFFDVWKMLGGYVIMFVYTVLMLGRLNKKEVRLYLSGAGIFSCILGLGAAFGIMFLLGMEYNQTHHILPFIAIGILYMICVHNIMRVYHRYRHRRHVRDHGVLVQPLLRPHLGRHVHPREDGAHHEACRCLCHRHQHH